MLSREEIERGKYGVKYSMKPHHMNDDNIRAAYEWLDAQPKLIHPTSQANCIKHLVELWCGFYVSKSDVEVAAFLHPEIFGVYPYFNIHGNTVEPLTCRRVAFMHKCRAEPCKQYIEQIFYEKVQVRMKRVLVRRW